MDANKKRKLDVQGPTHINLQARIITVAAGRQLVEYQVHEDPLRSRSPFFAAALSKSWEENRKGRIELPVDEASTVMIYLQSLYTGKINMAWSATGDLLYDGTLPEFFTLAHMYVFGEKYGDVIWKNIVMRAILRRIDTAVQDGTNYHPMRGVVDVIYRGTTAGSPARKLMVDNTMRNGEESWLDKSPEHIHPEFMFDVARAALRIHQDLEAESYMGVMNYSDYLEAEKSLGFAK